MYLNRDMDGGPFLVYFLPIFGGQKAAVSDSIEGWCATDNLRASRVSMCMDDRMDGKTDDEKRMGQKVAVSDSDAPPSSLCDPKKVQRVGFAEMVRNLVPLPASNTKRGRGVVLEAPGLD